MNLTGEIMELTEKNIKNFWSKVSKSTPKECWGWTGATSSGYGYFGINSKTEKAHRVSWVIHYGEIPKGLNVCHQCDNPSCVNPNHLFVGTQSENMRDSVAKDRFNRKLTNKQVREIRQLYPLGKVTQSELSRIYNVSRQHIHQIINRQVWKNI